ncbi:nuclear pore complex protein DDB_G0274915-like [Cloeon dipterum]|uniref:nuclear pore complex protein DDB_G0274915-like n=1 Tax=Cloeon dipterum TaxID=197152 RepID=UPI00321FA10C
MAICKYFLQGRCVYGAQCRNEHSYSSENRHPNVFANPQKAVSFGGGTSGSATSPINYGTLKRTCDEEVRLTQGGKQWPFSCFCPLKEAGNIPELDDLSPEELRFDAYTAQNQNNFDAYKNKFEQLKKEYEDKKSRLMNLDVKGLQNLLSRQSYGGAQSVFGSSNPQTPNPFQSTGSVFGSNANQSPKPFAQTSLFGQATTPQKSIFGGSSLATNPPSGLFASATTTAQPVFGQTAPLFAQKSSFGQSSNLFGQQSTSLFSQAQGTSSVFGQSAQPSLFGQSTFGQQQPAQTSSLFGQSATFSQQPSAPQPTSFGQSNLFSQTTQPASVFGQSAPFSQPAATTAQSSNIFGQSTNSIFGQANTATSTSTGSLFGQSPAFSQQTNLFGQTAPSVFGQPAQQPQQQQQPAGQSLFGQTAASSFGQKSIFGQSPAQPPAATSLFGQAAATPAESATPAFGSQAPAAPAFGQTPGPFSSPFTPAKPPSGLFAAAAANSPAFAPTSTASASPFGNVPAFGAQPTPQQPQAAPLFESKPFAPAQEASVFAQTPVKLSPFGPAAAVPAGNHYSPLEALTNEQIEQFNNSEFKLGSIPTMPPARQMCC